VFPSALCPVTVRVDAVVVASVVVPTTCRSPVTVAPTAERLVVDALVMYAVPDVVRLVVDAFVIHANVE
jgi:hypothetical protein